MEIFYFSHPTFATARRFVVTPFASLHGIVYAAADGDNHISRDLTLFLPSPLGASSKNLKSTMHESPARRLVLGKAVRLLQNSKTRHKTSNQQHRLPHPLAFQAVKATPPAAAGFPEQVLNKNLP